MQASHPAEWSSFPRRVACAPECEGVADSWVVMGKGMLGAGVGEMMSLVWGTGSWCYLQRLLEVTRRVCSGPGRVAQLAGALSVHQKVVGSFPSEGAYGRQPFNVSLSFSLLFLVSKINRHVLW